jgi:hypothetical protein
MKVMKNKYKNTPILFGSYTVLISFADMEFSVQLIYK